MSINIYASIIVPVYNAQEHIRECLDSLTAQTDKRFEVLLVDDGSDDTSGSICDEYSSSYGMFSVIHKENSGPSSARNLGDYSCLFGTSIL